MQDETQITAPVVRSATISSEMWGRVLSFPNTERGELVYQSALEQGFTTQVAADTASFAPFRKLDPELIITSDTARAAKAFLITRSGEDAFLPLTWIGEFADRDGPFYAYVRRGCVPFSCKDQVQQMFALDPSALHAKLDDLRADQMATPSELRLHRQMSNLRRDLSRFELVSGVAVPPDALLLGTCFVENNMHRLFLDGEMALPDLTARQIANIMHVMRCAEAKRLQSRHPAVVAQKE